MNISFFLLLLFSQLGFSQTAEKYISHSPSLNQAGALELFTQANNAAQQMNRNVTVAVLDASGVTILLVKNNSVGVHNTEASRRKAFTALSSTKTASYQLMHNAALNKDANNLITLPELLLLGGGVPIWYNQHLIGAIGVSGGGSGENDDLIAKQAIENAGFNVNK